MIRELVTLLGEREIGRVRQMSNGRLRFAYHESWQSDPEAYPLSLSMPLAQTEHAHAAIDSYLWGLLPDNEVIIERWARRYKVSARSAFALLSHVGEDCPGAVRFVTEERLPVVLAATVGNVEWITEHDVAERLRALHADASAWHAHDDTGQFSLPGAQPKTAYVFDRRKKRWGIPDGRTPTTHIVKPGIEGLEGHVSNEYFCLVLAAELGLPVARARVERFEDQVAIVVERYDRLITPGRIVRIHQEDTCQALGVQPHLKYENQGGPGARAIVALLREQSSRQAEDVATFVQALAYNFLIAGTDAHAKNYSILIGSQGRVRLAPLYDLASVLPYDAFVPQKIALAMKIGGKYRLRDIGRHQWMKLATELQLDGDEVLSTIARMAGDLPERVRAQLAQTRKQGLTHRILGVLADRLSERARLVARTL